ncbi:methyltransferase [Spartinivicinus poritis]|uniref:Ribosomal RNA large subunit methyltransferase G n=1 Tax=Spartinivicinus poritis TaxID=2994640 RepID=A0ABT5U2G3_9GAMM|nr:methyltransferase [Spartinivicinus sp. A2-2]MDE1460555.1 methyltransferase [Spartinivicinus sp. A2-2]
MNHLTTVWHSLELNRYPKQKNETLRAWDAADEYLLSYLHEQNIQGHCLIINDGFGALSANLHQLSPTVMTDSFLSQQSIIANSQANQLTSPTILPLTEPLEKPRDYFKTIIIKIPKTLALLEAALLKIRPLINSDTLIIAAGMVKYIQASMVECIQQLIGPTKPSLAKKKARLIHITPDQSILTANVKNPYPKELCVELPSGNRKLNLINFANVFGQHKLDIGSRFFLENLASEHEPQQIIDLGCGNGLLAMATYQHHPDSQFTLVDESFSAVASAKAGWSSNKLPEDQARFVVNDCLTSFANNSADYIVCNPPFHQQHTVGDHIAWRMFSQAKQVLQQGGELRIIGNRHLGYHIKLKRLFGNVQMLANNSKFVILQAVKR